MSRAFAVAAACLSLLLCAPAHAFETFTLGGRVLRLDITADSVLAWHTKVADPLASSATYDYGDFLNRVNVQLSWWKLTGAARLDTATFFLTPSDDSYKALALNHLAAKPNETRDVATLQQVYWAKLQSDERNAYWLGKSWLTFAIPQLEVTAGDSYVSLGRGLVLSMRKQDELAVDNTLLGGKIIGRLPYVNGTFVAGIANPVRVDAATGESLFPLSPLVAGDQPVPIFESDAIFGGKIEGTWKGAALSAQGVHMIRPDTLGEKSGIRGAREIDIGGGALTVPFPGNFGSAYLEGAYQHFVDGLKQDTHGFAFYGTATGGWGPLSAVVEVQHYRNFDPLRASIDFDHAAAFSFLQYSAPPNTEVATADTRFGYFDRCVTGGRARVNGRIQPWLMVYGAFGYWATWGEHSVCPGFAYDAKSRDDVFDGLLGAEVTFDESASHLFTSLGFRQDTEPTLGQDYYREYHVEVDLSRQIRGPWSAELQTQLRRRYEAAANGGEPWSEGSIYLSGKYSPYLVLALGFEFTGQKEQKLHAGLNAALTYKYREGSSIALFVGQQRGGLKCVSGACRVFPDFQGAKLEWVQRY